MFEPIPSYFKEQNRWLLWDSASDTPRRPHWKGDFGISWNDPKDWHGFGEAVAAAEEQESWGIGFVVQPEDSVYIVDVDGPFDESGEPHDWFPGLDSLKDTYVEWSPSGDSIHAAVKGDPPEWWSDCERAPDKHEGVDVLTNKFCTFTGERVDSARESVCEIGVASWLTQAYHGLEGSLPGTSTGESRDIDSDLAEEAVENALDNINPDLPHNEWVNVGFALHDWDAGTRGKRLFTDWSKAGTKWDANAENTVEYIWTKATQGAGVTVGSLIHKAKQSGWSPPRNVSAAIDWETICGQFDDNYGKSGRMLAADKLEDTTSWMYVLESEILYYYDQEAGWFRPWGEAHARSILERNLSEHFTSRTGKEIIDRLQHRNQVHRSTINGAEYSAPLLCVGNGVVDLGTGELREHSPDYKFTRGLRWDYAPERADAEPAREFLDDVTMRKADRDTLLDHLAHGLMPGHPYRAFVMMHGPGSNGKTRVGKLFRQFVGEDNAAAVELQDLTGSDDFATGALPGAYINVGDDVSVGEIRDSSTLKSLTGGATMRANEKNRKKFDFQNEAAMFFSANEPPRIAEKSKAIGDRLYPIEMPFRFLDEDELDPDNPMHKLAEDGIVERLRTNEAAMRGLLLMAVEHAKQLVESGGEYSMPESSRERQQMYEAASDPIHRFAYNYFEQGDGDDVLLKDDVYAVYKRMCDDENERTVKEDVFKQQIAKQSIVDVESCRSRGLTDGESRDRGWKQVQFTEAATEYMPTRVAERYQREDAIVENDDDDGMGATPLSKAAESLTGYVTVTVEVVSVERVGDTDTTKAVLTDESGAMDFLTWESDVAGRLESFEGETIAIHDAEVAEYDGTRQLQAVEGLTDFQSIQAGVGHTEAQSRSAGQDSLTAATDGSGSLKQRLIEHLRAEYDGGEFVKPAKLAGEVDADPKSVASKLESLAKTEGIVDRHGDSYTMI